MISHVKDSLPSSCHPDWTEHPPSLLPYLDEVAVPPKRSNRVIALQASPCVQFSNQACILGICCYHQRVGTGLRSVEMQLYS